MYRSTRLLKEDILNRLEEGCRNAEQWRGAIPVLVEVQNRIEALQGSLKELRGLQKALNTSVSEYADAHPKAFDSIREVKDETDVSLVTIDGVTYSYKRGWNGIGRKSGSNKTEAFLASLPKEWVRTRSELNVSAIGEANVSDAELAKHDLAWQPSRVWDEEDVKHAA